MQPTTTYPLLFNCNAKLFDSIELRIKGQAVVTIEDDGDGEQYYLAHGLRPGGISGIGSTLEGAYRDMERTMLFVFARAAVEADTKSNFESEVHRLFYHNASEWAIRQFEKAREAVAAGRVESDLKIRESSYSLEVSGWRPEEPVHVPSEVPAISHSTMLAA